MDYKSKYTASEIDAKLSQVFDSILQVKEVEVSEDTTITPDEGFLGLKEVNVKMKEGGNGGNTVYINTEELDNQTAQILYLHASLVKIFNGDIVPPRLSNGYAIAVAVNPSDRVIMKMEPEFDGTVEQLFLMMGNIDLSTMPLISKEEFYSTPKPTIIIETESKSLTIDGETGTVIKNDGYNITTNNGKVEQVRITTSDSWIAITANFAFNLPTTSYNLLASTTVDKMNHYIEIMGSGTAQYQFAFGALTISVS